MGDGPRQRFGAYLVYDQIGRGGTASVHRAVLGRADGPPTQVALKRLLAEVALRKELVASFVHEARLLRYLHHPNIPVTYDSGKIDGTHFIAMEYVAGPTLDRLAQQCALTVGLVPTMITLNVASQICDALEHAHNRSDEDGAPLGIVHRDISPSNVIVSETGLVKLIDFGLAKATAANTETAEGVIKGKFNYVAPEYLDGQLDARADLWALGVVMYELLTGRRLFDAPDDFETVTRVRRLPIPRPSLANPAIAPALDDVVMTALARDPARRWQTAAELRAGLRAVITQLGQAIANQHVSAWIHWVFTLKPGARADGLAKLRAITSPPPPPPPLPAPIVPLPADLELRPRRPPWAAIAAVVAVLVVTIWLLVS